MSKTWLLTGHKAGDNTQMRALAQSLGVEIREIPMRYTPWELLVTVSGRASLAGIEREIRPQVSPPWPDLVLTAGRRNEAAALHIGKASHGKAKIVHLGRPWHRPDRFDLVLFSAQYMLTASESSISLQLPLAQAAPGPTRTPAFEQLPKPHIALLIGGNSGAMTLDDRHMTRLLSESCRLADSLSGSLLVSTSARTPAWVDTHLARIEVPHHVWRWGAPDNPYADYLASADALIVTCDSASMLSDALATGKPLLIFDFMDEHWWRHIANYRLNALVHRLAMRLAPRRTRRDIRRMHVSLIEAGHAAWLSQGRTKLPECVPYENTDLQRATAAVRKLLGAG